MMRLKRVFIAAIVITFLLSFVDAPDCPAARPSVAPLENAHAHNDYLHDRPLFDALDHGFTSLEADIFLIDGQLLVGHARDALKPERTLESLYLAPLAKRVYENGAHVYSKPGRFFLLIDIKDDPAQTYRVLEKVLAKYADMLTTVEAGNLRPGAIAVVLTGNRPTIDVSSPQVRYVGLDGRLSDLNSRDPAHWMPMISDNWPKTFTWKGDGPMPAKEEAKLRSIVKQVHTAGRMVRFWGTPENEAVWRELRTAGVDLINTDQLERLAKFLNAADAKPRQ
jgi:hypothetical protein